MTDKKNRQIMNGLMAILLIVVLMIPAISTLAAREIKVQAVITADTSDFNQVAFLNSGPINETEWDLAFWMYMNIANESNPDSVISEDSGNEYGFYNDVTTVNNTNYVLANYSLFAHSGQIDYNFHAMDSTCENVANVDFLKLVSTVDDTVIDQIDLIFWDGVDDFDGAEFIKTGNQTWVCVIDLALRNHLLTVPDSIPYLGIEWSHGETPDDAYNWVMTTNDLTSSSWALDEGIVMALSTMVSICMLAVTIAFNTDTLDIKFDHNRKDNR